MSTTLGTFKTAVLRSLQDPSQVTFTDPMPLDFISSALIQVGRFAPARFEEDLTPVANQRTYQLQASVLTDATPEIEVVSVELYDTSQTPEVYRGVLQAVSNERRRSSANGWTVWNGSLTISTSQLTLIDVTTDVLRVRGYRPYPAVSDDADVMPVSAELLDAMRTYCRIEGLRQLLESRELYTQWQTRSNNSDVTPASLMNGLAQAEQRWDRLSRDLLVQREAPG